MRSILLLSLMLLATIPSLPAAEDNLIEKTWTVEGLTRKALFYVPSNATKTDTPVVFQFHGHGGTMRHSARYGLHKLWPEAIFVYMQGVPTPSARVDPEGKRSGWQGKTGEHNDRDLKFFDQVLSTLKKDYKVDTKRIYSTGHSNGGLFTYLLWAARGDVFAAMAPSAAGIGPKMYLQMKPLPAMHIAGETDELVSFATQQVMMKGVKRLNGCESEGKPWAKSGKLVGTIYESKTGTPFVSVIFPGNHTFPEEAPALIVKFFKEHAKK